MDRKTQMMQALRAFAEQRPGIDPRNYGDWRAYRRESASVTVDLHQARELMRAVELADSITADMIVEATRAYSGRLSLVESDKGIGVDYCTGQYFATEFRCAVCAVMASALWTWTRDHCMPAPAGWRVECDWTSDTKRRFFLTEAQATEYALTLATERYPSVHAVYGDKRLSAGDWIRARLAYQFGRTIGRRWFN